jgi:hypothetical protein
MTSLGTEFGARPLSPEGRLKKGVYSTSDSINDSRLTRDAEPFFRQCTIAATIWRAIAETGPDSPPVGTAGNRIGRP